MKRNALATLPPLWIPKYSLDNLLEVYAPIWGLFLFWALVGIGELFQVGTPCSSVPLRETMSNLFSIGKNIQKH